MNFEEVKSNFENRSYEHRVDFINDYHFNDEFILYYKNFIIKNTKIKDRFYLSELIDLSRYLGFFDYVFYERFSSYVFEKRHFLIKLSSLDYMIDCKYFYEDKKIEGRLNNILERNIRKILRVQILINLLCLNPRSDLLNALKLLISEIEDWRIVYRVLNQFSGIDKLKSFRSEVFELIKDINEGNKFGNGVSNKLDELGI